MLLKSIGNIILNLSIAAIQNYNLDYQYPKAFINPPKEIFLITLLGVYFILGLYAGYIKNDITAFVYYLMLATNFIWTALHYKFDQQYYAFGLLVLMFILTLLLLSLKDSYRIFLIPYTIWIIIMGYLNATSIKF